MCSVWDTLIQVWTVIEYQSFLKLPDRYVKKWKNGYFDPDFFPPKIMKTKKKMGWPNRCFGIKRTTGHHENHGQGISIICSVQCLNAIICCYIIERRSGVKLNIPDDLHIPPEGVELDIVVKIMKADFEAGAGPTGWPKVFTEHPLARATDVGEPNTPSNQSLVKQITLLPPEGPEGMARNSPRESCIDMKRNLAWDTCKLW